MKLLQSALTPILYPWLGQTTKMIALLLAAGPLIASAREKTEVANLASKLPRILINKHYFIDPTTSGFSRPDKNEFCVATSIDATAKAADQDMLVRFKANQGILDALNVITEYDEDSKSRFVSSIVLEGKERVRTATHQMHYVVPAEMVRGEKIIIFRFCFSKQNIDEKTSMLALSVSDLNVTYAKVERYEDGSINLASANRTFLALVNPAAAPPAARKLSIPKISVAEAKAAVRAKELRPQPKIIKPVEQMNFVELSKHFAVLPAGQTTELAQILHFATEGNKSCSGFAIKVDRSSKLQDFGVQFYFVAKSGLSQPTIVDKDGKINRHAVAIGPAMTELTDEYDNLVLLYRVLIPAESLVEGETLYLKLCFNTAELKMNLGQYDKIYSLKSAFHRMERDGDGQVTIEGMQALFGLH